MTPQAPKPREWWIGISDGNTAHIDTKQRWSTDHHVIEYSAYAALQSRCEELEAEIKRQEKGRLVALQAMHNADDEQEKIHSQLNREREVTAIYEAALKLIIAYDKRLPDFTDNPQTMMAYKALQAAARVRGER